MATEAVVGEFPDQAQAAAAIALLRAHEFQVDDLVLLDSETTRDRHDVAPLAVSKTPGNVLVTVQPTERHEEARRLLCDAGAIETDFSLTGHESAPAE